MVDKKLVKSAGEHWVCTVLSGQNWAVALTRDGLERTDILAVHTATRRRIEVQVKAASHSTAEPQWMLGTKAQQPAVTPDEWFVLVGLPQVSWEAPRSFVVPRDHVAAAAWIRHMDWLTDPDAAPGTRNTPVAQVRAQAWVFEGYEDRWDLLGVPGEAAPVLLPPRFHQLAAGSRVGLPPSHPWREELPDW